MRHAWVSGVGIGTLVGVIMLSIGLVFMADIAGSATPTKSGSSATSTQNWDTNMPSASRFTVLSNFGGAAVRDNNTGLVWDQSPDTTDHTWASATSYCANKTVGGTAGWRLPSVVELKSVQDLTLVPPLVPPSVFTNVQPAFYWSATSTAAVPGNAWYVDFGSGGPVRNINTSTVFIAWCVHGPMNADAY